MKKKIVFFDIDGTLWDWNRFIPESTKRAISELREAGHLAVICSGRARGNIRAKELLDLGFDGIVAACGAYVELNGEVIFERKLPAEVVKETVETVMSCDMPVVLEGSKKHWVSDWGFETDDYVAYLFTSMGEDALLLKGYTPDIEINKFSADVLVKTDYKTIKERLSPYYDFIEHGLTPDLDPNQGNDPMSILAVVEAVPCGISKADGVKRVCEYLDIDMADTFAIGDSANDIEMFEAVGHSICMGNGADSAKAAAEYVTSNILDDGIYNALKHYGII